MNGRLFFISWKLRSEKKASFWGVFCVRGRLFAADDGEFKGTEGIILIFHEEVFKIYCA